MPRLTGGEIVVEHLVREGVPYAVAGSPGTDAWGLWTPCGGADEGREDVRIMELVYDSPEQRKTLRVP